MTESNVTQRVEDRVLTLTLDRPAKKNALTMAMYDELSEGLDRALSDANIRVVVLRGAQGVFTSGNDLKDFRDNPPDSADSPVGRFLQRMRSYAMPILAGVEGLAIGVGTTMLLHCDMVYAAKGTRFALPFTSLGLVPEAGSSYLLPRVAGRARASELLMLGEPFDADVAKELGLVNEVLEPQKLHERVAQRAAALAKLPPASLRETKRLIRNAIGQGLDAAFEAEMKVFFERLRSPEAAEAMQAFFEKRPADFSRFE